MQSSTCWSALGWMTQYEVCQIYDFHGNHLYKWPWLALTQVISITYDLRNCNICAFSGFIYIFILHRFFFILGQAIHVYQSKWYNGITIKHELYQNVYCLPYLVFMHEARHEKTDLKVFVVVMPKQGWAHVPAPILLLAWHRLFENITYDVSRVKFWKVGVIPKDGWTTTKT